jgi:hypothetical protein
VDVAGVLLERWDLKPTQVEVLTGGMNSAVWLADEVETGLTAFLRVRWAVQAGHFAWRCSTDVRTGIADPAENHKGLADARRAFDAADH